MLSVVWIVNLSKDWYERILALIHEPKEHGSFIHQFSNKVSKAKTRAEILKYYVLAPRRGRPYPMWVRQPPRSTLRLLMMTGSGQFGPIEMGGMFTTVKIREGLAANDYKDPGPYDHPERTVAYEFKGKAGEAPRQKGQAEMQGMEMPAGKAGTKAGHKGIH